MEKSLENWDLAHSRHNKICMFSKKKNVLTSAKVSNEAYEMMCMEKCFRGLHMTGIFDHHYNFSCSNAIYK